MKHPAPQIAIGGIASIILAIFIGPLLSPPEFSWVRHTTSEQAGQLVSGAWVMRSGFVAYGTAIIAASAIDARTRPFVRVALAAFGCGLIATAIWSNASFLPQATSDMHEDLLHSIASSFVGIAFATACAARLFAPGGSSRDLVAWTGLVMSVAVPLAMSVFPDVSGMSQRIMFAVSFLFVWREFRETSANEH